MSEQDEELPPQLPGECLEPPQLTTITDVDKDDLKQEYISAMDRFEGANMDTSTADMSLQSSMPSTSVNPFHPSFELENVTAVSVEQTPGINTVSVSPSDEREVVRMDTNTKNVIEPVSIATPGANSSHTNGNAQIKQSTSSFSGSQEHEGSHVSISFNNEKIPSANVNTSVGDSVHNVSASMTVDDVAQEVSVSRIPIIRNVSSSESSESPDKNDSPTKFVHLVDDHAETFRNHLHQQWLKAQYCDLTLRVKDNEVKVHSCVFSAFSPRGCQNERRKVVFLPDVSYSSVDALVRMMYTGILCFDAGEAAKVLHAAKELMMTEMVTLIQNYINQCPLPDSGIRISQKPSGGLSVSQSATPVQTTSQSGRQKRGRGRPRKSDKSESQSVSTPESVSPKRKRRATTFKDIVPGLSERVLRQHVPKDPPSEEFEIKIETEETDDDDGDEAFDETHGTSSEDTIVKQEIMDEEDEEVQEEEGDATETVGRAKECSSSISMNPGRIHDDLDSSKDVHPHGLADGTVVKMEKMDHESKKKSDGCIDVKGMAEDNSSINTFGDDNEDDNGSRKEIGQTSEGSKNKGTEQKTMSNLNTLLSYLREKRHEQRQIHEVPPKELNNHLCQFFTQTKKMNGEEYDPSTLKGMLASFNRHLRKQDYQFCLVKSKEFARLNSLLSSKLLDLKKRFGGKPQNLKADLLTDTEVDLLYETGQLGLNSAKSLIHTVWFNNMICFGVRNFNVHHNLKWGDVQLKTDADGKEYLELIQGMTRNIANVNDFRHETPKMWAKPENPGRCPVSAYKKYREMRPPFCKEPTDPFYLAPANTKKTQLWFKAYGVGINNLRSFLKDMTTEAGIINVGPHRKRVTDHIAGTYNINGQKSTGTQSGNDNSAAQTKLYQATPIVIGGKKLQPIRPAVYNINPTIVITGPQVISRPIMPMVNVEPNQTQAQTQAKAQAQGQAQSQARAQAFPIHVVPNESIHERLFGGALNIIPSSQGKN